jgi:signal peptidase I
MDIGPPQRLLGCELIADLASNFGQVRLKVTGASMIPAIWPGDVITVRHSGIADLKSGQIILLTREGNLVAHRVACVCDDFLITRGDSLQDDDPPITESDLVGEVVCVIRNGSRVHLKHSSWQRVGSFILRRSDFCLRMALRLGRRLRRPGRGRGSWVS